MDAADAKTAVLEKRIERSRSVRYMLTSLSHSFIYVLDHEQAVDFYVNKLGLEVGGTPISARSAGSPSMSLASPNHRSCSRPPRWDTTRSTAAAIRELVTKGGGTGLIFSVDDCRKTYEALVEKGVEFTQEPTEHFYGIDCGLRDPFGNPLRITQPAPQPLQIPPREEVATG